MLLRALLAPLLASVPLALAAGGDLRVPSGQEVTLHEVLMDTMGPSGLTVRFRFVTPQIGAARNPVDFDTASQDMAYLCDAFALPRTQSVTGPKPSAIIISFADRAFPFGESYPEATQFFEFFLIQDGACALEAF